MTDDEFFAFCRANDPIELERDKFGNIIIVSPTGSKTGNINLTLASRVFLWNEETNAGYAFDSSTGFKLPNGATRSTNVAWIQKDRWEAISEDQQEKFAPVCSDFIIELHSASDDLTYLQDKLEEYRENGCRLGWLIDRKTQQVFIYRPQQPVETISSFSQTLSGDDVLPSFAFDLALLTR
ncbi:Uma2 family endonuclease [Spirosoma validum]|uniref:Uma2 family endonuclease n=1 Tax=Spirosoma validum TaxID=2771355 RepID=A0A927B7J9_9BACT|nr:Uma2 family endonuclease [Spirosoma validum]MBD2756824.1 Uma2 family endonuclease [Spirosoma validum]